MLFWLGYQAPYQPQCNPHALRAGAPWQKFIRRAAKVEFGDEPVVNNIHGTLIEENIGSGGEISDWVDGRTWRLEPDDHLDSLRRWRRDPNYQSSDLGSPEYRAKKAFMHQFVKLCHRVGAYELARQYTWVTHAVNIVPVFGEKGVLLEHSIFNGFYNWPLTIQRNFRKRKR